MSAHPEIDVVQRRLDEVVEAHFQYLRHKPTPFLEELQHRSADAMQSAKGCEHCAAQINHDIAAVVLETRKAKP